MQGIDELFREPTRLALDKLFDEKSRDTLTWNRIHEVSQGFLRITARIPADLLQFLFHFLVASSEPALLKRYIATQFGKFGGAAVSLEQRSLLTGGAVERLQAGMGKLKNLAVNDCVPKAELDTIVSVLSSSRADITVDLEALARFFSGTVAGGEEAIRRRINTFKRVTKQLTVLEIVNPFLNGLGKLGLGAITQSGPADDRMLTSVSTLQAAFNEALSIGYVDLSAAGTQTDDAHIQRFLSLTHRQTRFLRDCGRYAEVRQWLKTKKYDTDSTLFKSRISYVTQLIAVSGWYCPFRWDFTGYSLHLTVLWRACVGRCWWR